jgi:hypothetical protein
MSVSKLYITIIYTICKDYFIAPQYKKRPDRGAFYIVEWLLTEFESSKATNNNVLAELTDH